MASKIFGVAKWILDADTRKLKKGAAEAKKEIDDVGDAGAKAGKKIGGGFSGASEKIEKSTEGVRKFQGAISGAIGAVTGLVAIGSALVAVLIAIATRAQKAREKALALAGAYHDVEQSINDYDRAFEATKDADEERYFATLREIDANKDLTDEYRQQMIEKAHAVMVSNKEAREADKAAEATRVWESFYKAKAGLETELSDDLAVKEDAIYKARLDNLRAAFSETGLIGTTFFGELEDLEADLHKKRLAHIAAQEKKKKDALEERLQLEATALAERLRKEYESKVKAAEDSALAFAKSLTASTSNFTTRMDSIIREIQNVSRVNGRR